MAQEWCEDVIVGDIEQLDLKGALGRRFDVILFLDILEHLKDPLDGFCATPSTFSPIGVMW